MTSLQKLDRAGQLLLEAQELLKYHHELAEAIEIVVESIDREIEYEEERIAHEN